MVHSFFASNVLRAVSRIYIRKMLQHAKQARRITSLTHSFSSRKGAWRFQIRQPREVEI